uniref:TCDD-inducible poly(ADP-ribose) polymerase n=1 Tax=Poecilia formosa TaxID=48698 RepID=A0A087XF35_POEFO
LQKSAERVPTAISLDVSLNMDEAEDFTEQPIVGLSDKIPLVKPYFRKKQRKLDHKCLQRSLDPILTSLLSTDTLVSGDGVFVPRSQPGRTPGTLCAAAVVKQSCVGQVCLKDPGAAENAAAATGVQGLMSRDVDVEIANTTAELEETEVPHQEGSIIKSKDLLTSGAKSVSVKDSSAIQDPRSQLLQPDKGVLFQNKSEEASLDLVFELLTQLQYHTHQSDSVDICVDFLQGRCVFGNDCAHHHTVLPYHWQIRRSNTQTWQSIADDSQEQLERLYCNPDQE